MKTLYPPLEPHQQLHLKVSDTHKIYVEACGNPSGIPVLFVHGGPGAGAKEDDRCFFDPAKYHIILFDQRGCGRSQPLGEINDNTTADLVADMEAIRQHFEVSQWVVFGGSWGSTLSLVYAQTHVERVLGLVLRGVFFAEARENHWLWQEGLSRFYPEAYQRYQQFIPSEQRHDLIAAYYAMMTTGDQRRRHAAAVEMMRWESAGVSVNATAEPDDAKLSFHQGLLEAHYCAHGCFLAPNQIRDHLGLLTDIPIHIVNGRYDMLTSPTVAYQLHQALPQSQLRIVDMAGHASKEPAMVDALVSATDDMLRLLSHDH